MKHGVLYTFPKINDSLNVEVTIVADSYYRADHSKRKVLVGFCTGRALYLINLFVRALWWTGRGTSMYMAVLRRHLTSSISQGGRLKVMCSCIKVSQHISPCFWSSIFWNLLYLFQCGWRKGRRDLTVNIQWKTTVPLNVYPFCSKQKTLLCSGHLSSTLLQPWARKVGVKRPYVKG